MRVLGLANPASDCADTAILSKVKSNSHGFALVVAAQLPVRRTSAAHSIMEAAGRYSVRLSASALMATKETKAFCCYCGNQKSLLHQYQHQNDNSTACGDKQLRRGRVVLSFSCVGHCVYRYGEASGRPSAIELSLVLLGCSSWIESNICLLGLTIL